MNHRNHHALALGPCEGYEFDLVERSEGGLDAARAPIVEQHLERCSRCGAYAEALAELDAAMASALPPPHLAADFDARLAARIAALQTLPDRTAAVAAATREHEQLLRGIGHGLSWRTLLNAVALGSIAGGAVLGLDAAAPGMLRALDLVPDGITASTTFSILLGIAFMASGLMFARQPGGANFLTD